MATARADVGRADAGAQAVGEALDGWEEPVDQRRVVRPPVELILELVELRPVLAVGDAAALLKRARDGRDEPTEVRHRFCHWCQVGGCIAGEAGGALASEAVLLARRVVGRDATGGHGAEPLAHVPLRQARPLGERGARGGARGEGVERPRAPADRDHVGGHRGDALRHELAGKCLHLRGVKL